MSGLVNGQHYMAPSSKFDGKTGLGFPRIDVAVDGNHARGRFILGSTFRQIQERTDQVARASGESQVMDGNAPTIGLGETGDTAADQYCGKTDSYSNLCSFRIH